MAYYNQISEWPLTPCFAVILDYDLVSQRTYLGCNVPNRSHLDLTPHVYQYTFASNPNWSRFYPPGPEFEEYLRGVAKKYDVYKKTKFAHRFQSATWHEDIGQWEVTVLRMEDNTVSLHSRSLSKWSTNHMQAETYPSLGCSRFR
jgi:hypothetical protein